MFLLVSTAAPILTRTRWSRDLIFHLTWVLTATVGMTFWIVGVSTSLSLAITYFGLVVALGTLLGCRWFARLERRRAGIVLGSPLPEYYVRLQDDRWTARPHALMGDPTTWRDFAWTGASGIVGMTLSVLAVSLWAGFLAVLASVGQLARGRIRRSCRLYGDIRQLSDTIAGARHAEGRIRRSCRLVGDMGQLFDTIARIAGRQHGRVTWRQLRAAGVDTDRIGRWSADGRLRRVHHGVYAVGHTAPSPHAELMAAVLACGEGARASHHSGGHLVGILRFRPIEPHVTVPTTAGRKRPGILIHRVPELHRDDVTSYSGIPTTSVPRVLLDLAPHLTPPELSRACHEAWVRCQITPRHVESCIARNPTKKGVAKLRRAQLADVTLSVLEDGFLQLLRGHDLPMPRTNIDVAGDKVDCHWPSTSSRWSCSATASTARATRSRPTSRAAGVRTMSPSATATCSSLALRRPPRSRKCLLTRHE